MLNSWKTIFSHFFISYFLYFFRFYYAEMRGKLWPKAPAKKGVLGEMSKKFQVYTYKFF